MAENKKILMKLEDIKMYFPLKKKTLFQKERYFVKAVDGITVDIYEGETLGLVGESGCGKSTLGRVILQLYNQTAGSVRYLTATMDSYAPAYARTIIRKIGAVGAMSARELIDHHLDCVRLAGGMLADGDRTKVSALLMEKYEAIAKQDKLETKVRELELKVNAYQESKELSAKDRRAMEKSIVQRDRYQKELDACNKVVDEKSGKVDAFRDQCRGLPDFALYEAEFDHSIDLAQLKKEEMRVMRKLLQMIFQDPYSSLNPRLTVGQLIAEALVAHNMYRRGTDQMEQYTLDIMDKCGLQPYMLHRYPHQFSGGQRQRIGIARSLALKPQFVVCDEAVSALDVSIQSQIINLLMDLKEQANLTYLFISHDLSAVKFISDRIGVMYLGNLVELGDSDIIFKDPLHPYTEALLDAIPTTEDEANKELQIIEGDIPSPINPPPGCKFHTRCKYATEKCMQDVPEWRELKPGHFVACHYPLQHSGQ